MEFRYTNTGVGYFYITVTRADHVLRQWWFQFDAGGSLRYYYVYYPTGYVGTNNPFRIVPAVVDFNETNNYTENWDYVYRYKGDSTRQATIDTVVQGP